MRSVTLFLLAAASAYAASGDPSSGPDTPDLSSMTIEQLMDVSATSILKSQEKPSQAAAAIYIITEDAIRRSGMTSIPELLRLVPGMDVGREDGTTWSISARGFTNQDADKMLVLIDGRRVYDPLVAGVFWDAQDVPLYDIAQIEVIRGPGSSLWGADAVNGVINIITKSARDTQGLLVEAGGGNLDGSIASLQFGGKIGQHTWFRVFGKYNGQSLFTPDAAPSSTAEPWIQTERGGFRIDSELTRQDSLTVEGDFYTGSIGNYYLQQNTRTDERNGADVLTRWVHRLNNGSETTLQLYWDNADRVFYDSSYLRNTFDLDFEHQFTAAAHHNITWGLRANYTYDRASNGADSGLLPARLGFKIFDGLIQDEIPIAGNQFQLTVGSKVGHNDYTGFEWQPNIRLAWTPDERQTLWTALSRGVVVPSRSNRATYVNLPPTPLQPGGFPVAIEYTSNPNFTSQDLLAYEAGYRRTISPNLSFDLASFFNVYSHLVSAEAGVAYLSDEGDHLVEPYSPGNMMRGDTYGLEIAANWKPTEYWKITGSYSWLEMRLNVLPGSTDTSWLGIPGESPQHQLQIHSFLDLRHGFELDAAAYYSSALPAWNIAPYTRLDIRGGWRFGESAEISVVGQNLLADKHLEAISQSELPVTSIHRSIYGRILWRF